MDLLLHVNVEGPWEVPVDLLRAAAERIWAEEGLEGGELSLTFLGDEEIRALNRRFLDRDTPTDVLAFPLHSPGEPPLGDVYVGVPRALRQAEEWGVPPREELLRLGIHGILHVLGYDHPPGPERVRSPMFRRQEAVLREVLERG